MYLEASNRHKSHTLYCRRRKRYTDKLLLPLLDTSLPVSLFQSTISCMDLYQTLKAAMGSNLTVKRKEL